MSTNWQAIVAILGDRQPELSRLQALADNLNIPLLAPEQLAENRKVQFVLSWREDCLQLKETRAMEKPGLFVEIEHRQGEQRSWPMAKQGALAQALGRKTQTIVDATAGWGQDSLAMFRMGYEVTSIERHPVMAALLADAYRRLGNQEWLKCLNIAPPRLIQGDAISVLDSLAVKPDCIYLDPMFPPKRKKSALAKKSIMVLKELAGDDNDKMLLFATALQSAGKRVVVKSPDYAEPLGGKPAESFQGKLLRYDVYLK